ncbi:MAG TPA: SEC-C metal-binding domain-containing protein [Phycisphaerae bacterium]|nr:SEC-C metal-binding domain-containing protein [Phycisphaerae bacterium]
MTARARPKVARNQPCPCGSGRKAKHCCGAASSGTSSATAPPRQQLEVLNAAVARRRRPCAGCTACCTALIINDPGVVTPAGSTCPHECSGGCSIHGPAQPASCREYFCNYTISKEPLTDDERPDRVGAIVDFKISPDRQPPMHRTTGVVACAPDGLTRVLQNAHWRRVIYRDLAAGIPILAAQPDDPLNREVLGVRLQDDRLFCRLTSCDPNGRPILTTLQPVYDPPVPLALLIPEQGFIFDTAALIRVLGNREEMVVTPAARSADNEVLRFLFTRRQAAWVGQLTELLKSPAAPATAEPAACPA